VQGSHAISGTAPNVPVLMYHHVCPSGQLAVTPENFDRQIRWLARYGWHSLSGQDFAAYMTGKPVPPKSVVLTFDDGYLDNWVYAHPVLQQHGMTALLFVVTGWVGDGAARPHAGSHPRSALPPTPDHAACKKAVATQARDDVILRWSEIQDMQAAGSFEVHSHTHTHSRWDQQCATPAEKTERLQQDLERSRQALQQRLGSVSDHLCWPQGYFDDDYLDVAARAGFRHLYTTDARGQNRPGADTRHIYRVAAKNKGGLMFAQRLWLARHPYWGPLYNAWKKR
jgi:peptidoglycan/xylan/chitin deacetylase (PgdA/CDA1 family)